MERKTGSLFSIFSPSASSLRSNLLGRTVGGSGVCRLALKSYAQVLNSPSHYLIPLQSNICFCMAIAHFYCPTLAYNNELFSALISHWDSIFCSDTDAELVSASGPASHASAASPPSDSDLAPPPPLADSKLNPGPVGLMPNFNFIDHILNIPSPSVRMGHAWWDHQGPMEQINPLAAVHLWYNYRAKHVDSNNQLPIIWPSDELMKLWDEYNVAAIEVGCQELRHAHLCYYGTLPETANAADTIVHRAMYPIYPSFHRPLAPRQPSVFFGILQELASPGRA